MIKKLVIYIASFFLICPIAKANTCPYYCAEPYDLSAGTLRFMSTISGSKVMGEQVAKIILRREIKRNISGKFKVKITSFSTNDLKKGIFKNIIIKGSNLNLDGIEFKVLTLKSLCNFNYISLVNPQKPKFKEDLALSFSAIITEENLNHSMETDNYKRLLDDINNLGRNLGVFKISQTSIKIKDDQFYYIITVAIPFVKATQNIILTSDLKVNRGKIDFSNTKLTSESISINLKKIDRIINFLDPLDFSLNILENKDTRLMIQNVKIKKNKIYADGLLVIPRDED